MSHAGLIREGEWWRAVTALGLHADAVHLAGNMVFGIVFGFLAGELLGWGLAWFGMLLAGALGNALNAFVQAPGHTSIGASTAVFATLGILAAYTWKRRRTQINRWVADGGQGVLPCSPIFSGLTARWKDKVFSREQGSHIDTRFFAYLVVTLFKPTGCGVPSYVAK